MQSCGITMGNAHHTSIRTKRVNHHWECLCLWVCMKPKLLQHILRRKCHLFACQVIIEATRGDGIRGDIAIDDTSFSDGCQFDTNPLPVVSTPVPTQPLVTLPVCDPNTYQCRDGSCIDIDLRCDGTPDCPEAEDELNCGKETCSTIQVPWKIERVSTERKKFEVMGGDARCCG